MPQAAFWPTVPVSAAQRAGTWSVPRMRQVLRVTSTANGQWLVDLITEPVDFGDVEAR